MRCMLCSENFSNPSNRNKHVYNSRCKVLRRMKKETAVLEDLVEDPKTPERQEDQAPEVPTPSVLAPSTVIKSVYKKADDLNIALSESQMLPHMSSVMDPGSPGISIPFRYTHNDILWESGDKLSEETLDVLFENVDMTETSMELKTYIETNHPEVKTTLYEMNNDQLVNELNSKIRGRKLYKPSNNDQNNHLLELQYTAYLEKSEKYASKTRSMYLGYIFTGKF